VIIFTQNTTNAFGDRILGVVQKESGEILLPESDR
jgi:hypothetical protein